jgi:hypothetical protein
MALTSFLYDLQRGVRDTENRKRRRGQIVLPTGEVLTGAQADNYRKLQLIQAQGGIDKDIQASKNQGLYGVAGMEGQTARDVAGLRNKGLLAQTEMEGGNRLKAIGLEGKYSLDKQRMASETAENIAGMQTGSAEQIAVLNALAGGGKGQKQNYRDVEQTLDDGTTVTTREYFNDNGKLIGSAPVGQAPGGGLTAGSFNPDQYIQQRTGNTGLTSGTPAAKPGPVAPTAPPLPVQPQATRPAPLAQSPLVQPSEPGAPPDTSVKDVSKQIQGIVSMSGLGPRAPYKPMVKPVVDIGGAMSGLKSTFYDQGLKALKANLRILRNSKRK